jgi:hypothetical protein
VVYMERLRVSQFCSGLPDTGPSDQGDERVVTLDISIVRDDLWPEPVAGLAVPRDQTLRGGGQPRERGGCELMA